MPPTDTYKIQIEQIKNTDVDKPTKDLASRLVQLTAVIEKLERVMDKFIPAQENPARGVIDTVKTGIRIAESMEKVASKIQDTIQKLETEISGMKRELPSAITNALQVGKQAAIGAVGEKYPYAKEMLDAIKEMTSAYKQAESSKAYETDKDKVLGSISTLIKEISKKDRDVADIASSIQDAMKSVGMKAATREAPTTAILDPNLKNEVELFGKTVRSMGTEFGKIKDELKDKIVVAIDLETSENIGKKIGKEAAVEFISQIAYKKGTLGELAAGKGETKTIYVKPPRGVETGPDYSRLIGNIGGIPPIDFQTLKEKGIDAEKAMSQLADELKDAEAVIGHNVAKFDLQVLDQHFKRAGIQIDSAVDKFVDTLQVSQATFPERYGPEGAFKQQKPHALGTIEKDLEMAGNKFTGSLHDAAHDVEVLVTLLRGFEKGSKEYDALQANLAIKMRLLTKNIESASKVTAEAQKLRDAYKDAGDALVSESDAALVMVSEEQKYTNALRKATKSIGTMEVAGDPVKMRSALQAVQFKESVVGPAAGRQYYGYSGPEGVKNEKGLAYLGDLADSLNRLQDNIVKSLERGLTKGVEILRNKSGEAFQLGAGGREWELKLVDVRQLRRALADTFKEYSAPGSSPEELISAYKSAFVKTRTATPASPETMANAVVAEVGSLTKEQSVSLGKNVDDLFESIRKKNVTTKDIKGRADLETLYKDVALNLEATRSLNESFIKRLAVPAARISTQGVPTFETKYGAEKALANFASITTGLEKLLGELKGLSAPTLEIERYARGISKVPLRPEAGSPGEKAASDLADEMINQIVTMGGRTEVRRGYARAVTLKEVGRGAPIEEAKAAITSLPFDELIIKAKELGVTALDVAKALDEVDFKNFYDMLDQLFQAGKTPYIEKQAGNIHKFDRNLRDISGVVNDLLGLMPMIEPGRPLRAPYNESTVRVLTKPTNELKPEEQKQHIIDVGMLWKDLAKQAEQLNEGLVKGKEYLGRPSAASIDLSDAASSELKQFNLEFGNKLQGIDKTMIGMSTADLRGLAPFKDFSSIQRQLSYMTSGLTGGVPGGGKFETPALMSERERGMIEGGKFGTEGYGLNVLTELRNTAGTFEDQIMIAGKLANAFTQIVQRLAAPAATLLEQRRITEVEPGIQRMSPQAARALSRSEDEFRKSLVEVSDQFQEILGVPQKYKGRADVAEIGAEVENVMREHRGKTIEVQTAKLTETFLNYFGRKLATRFGTKGVTVTPELVPTEIKGYQDIAQAMAAGLKATVEPGQGLGYAKVPKSAGQLVSEMLEDTLGSLHDPKATMDLHNRLIESGNKFVLDMFKDAEAGLVTKEEAAKQAKLFEDVNEVWKDVFSESIKSGPTGIKEIKGAYEERFGEKGLTTLKPIEARISARGIAKRGLMPEILEALINNLVGTTAGSTTLKNNIEEKALTSSEGGRKAINEALLAVGYEPFKDIEGIVKRIKTEKPKATEAEIRDFIKEYESQWNVYTDVLNEFGEKVQSLVASKFLQVVEEPHQFGEWTPKELEKGIKGAKLDFQSFGAYMGVFGEGSSMMEELSKATSLTSQEGWELIKTFQMLDPSMKDLNKSILQSLPSVALKDIPKQFTDATASIEDLKDTIFDLTKFPTAFKLTMPSTTPGKKEEEMYMPGPSLRTTYREELMGRLAPTNVSRYLANLVSSAKEVEDLTKAATTGGMGLSEEFQQKYASNFKKELTTSLTSLVTRFKGMEETPTPQNISFMDQTIEKFKNALSETRGVTPIYQEGMQTSERGSLEEFIAKQKGPKKYSNVMGRISDLIVGADPESLRREEAKIRGAKKAYEESGNQVTPQEFATPYYEGLKERAYGGDFGKMMDTFLRRTQERAKASTIFDVELEAGNLPEFAKNVGLNLSQSIEEALTTKLESLSRAKISYFKAVGEEVFGKKKGVEQAFFQRVTPAITGKAVSAITDKTEELGKLLEVLNQGKNKLGIPGLEELSDTLEKVTKKHAEYVTKAKQLGLPVLREGEIAVPEEMAKKVKVEGGNLAELMKKDQDTYVESIRYPFTGTLSVQPHKAKLMEDILPTGKFGKQSIAVPGVPQLDLPELKGVLDTLKEFVGVAPRKNLAPETPTLMERRETAWAQGNQEEADKLTVAIKDMLSVIDQATPKFLDMEQKLDFDGDALFVHTGQLQSSRDEIKKHYDMLGDDVTSVRNLFRSVFSAVKETDVASLSEMATVFSKKHPAEKGFEFLTKPYIKEDVSNLGLPEVAKALFSYAPEAKGLEGANLDKTFGEWMSKQLATDIMPQVFGRMGTPEAERGGYMQRMQITPEGLPQFEGATEVEKRMTALADEVLRSELYQKKYSDAIAGQLYKLHTGQTVEGISRLARLSELETGFGTGLAGTGKAAPPSQEFLQRFPKESMALGGKPAEEFAVRVNEMMRFVIQKGMDVKHAGMQAVGQKIIENISKAGGVDMIKSAMTEMSDQFEELTDFNAQIANEAKLRLGAVSTEGLKGELKRFQLGKMNYEEIKREFETQGGKMDADVPREVLVDALVESAKKADLGKNRGEIVNEIISYIDIYAVFDELFRQIKVQAVKGYSEQLRTEMKELPTGPQKVKLLRDVEAAGGVENLATKKIEEESKDKKVKLLRDKELPTGPQGVSILKYVTSNLQPLYRMRTSMETIGTAADRAKGRVEPEKMLLPATEEGKRMADQFDDITRASRSLTESLATPVKGQRGVYTSMVTSAIKQRYAELEELQKLAQDAQPQAAKFEYAFSDIMDANKLAAKVWSESKELAGVKGGGMIPPEDLEITVWIDQLMKAKKIAQDKLESLAEKAGIPPMMPEEQSMLAAEFEQTHGPKTAGMIKELLESRALTKGEKIVPGDIETRTQDIYAQVQELVKFQVSMVEQFKRINEMIKTIPTQMAYMRGAFPDFEGFGAKSTRTASEATQEIKQSSDLLEEYWAKQKIASKTVSQAVEGAVKATPPVAAEDLQKIAAKSADEISQAINTSVMDRKRRAIQYLESLSKGGVETAGTEAPAYKVYSASGTHGGGMYGGGTQQEGVLRNMLGMQTAPMLAEATAFKGGAIHRKIQQEMVKKFPGAQIEQEVQDTENNIIGHFDVLYEEAGQKMVADIKTIYSTASFERLQEISDEITKRNITIQQKLDELKSKEITSAFEKDIVRRLEDYLSQVNMYLKNVEGAAGKIIFASQLDSTKRFEIPIGKFDPVRFDKDISEINKAKESVSKIVASISEGKDVPTELLEGMPDLYTELSGKIKELGSQKFLATMPTKKVGATKATAEEVLGRLTAEQQKRYDELSTEYLEMTKRAMEQGLLSKGETYTEWFATQSRKTGAPAAAAGGAGGAGGMPPIPPAPPGGAGGGDDYFEELRKRIAESLGKLERGGEPNIEEINRLVQTYKDALEAADAERERNIDLAKSFESLAQSIKSGLEKTGDSFEAFERVSQLVKNTEKAAASMGPSGPTDFERFRQSDIERIKPERPEAIHKNLRAMLESSVKYYRLGDTADIKKYGPQIEELLTGASEKGPIPEITQKLSDALSNLPTEQKGGMRRVWMMYKKAVGEYFLRRLDELKTQIEQEGDSPAGRKAYAEYEQVVDKYLKNIRTTLTKMSDIYTKVGPSGTKSEFVEPDLARLTGLYRNPQELTSQIKHDYGMGKETQPILDMMVGDLDVAKLDEMATPIDKVRMAFKTLTAEQDNLKPLLADMELFKRMGVDAIKAWDFDKLTRGITDLRAGLQAFHRLNISGFGGLGEGYNENLQKNVQDTIKLLKQLENAVSSGQTKASEYNLTPVPQFLDVESQRLLHRRNVAQLKDTFQTAQTEGGPAKGTAFTYKSRIIDPATKQEVENTRYEFLKFGDTLDSTGRSIGLFSQKYEDMIKNFQNRQGIGQAFERVIRWGIASKTVYGLTSALGDMISTISNVEVGMAYLKQVMSPLTTDFDALQNSAVQFAKNFGTSIEKVIDGMKVYAQQGLAQADVLDRTYASMLAVNVTTLKSEDATEALTAAMNSYGTEGESAIRFLDSWTEVEARHAVTTKDLADAMRKSASAAKTMGVSFDQLNAMITGVGETTRMTGSEIGTAMRFMTRRLQTEKAPKALAQIGVPVVGGEGEMRGAFDVLGDLAGQWDRLTSAQKVSIAESIGGIRHYNALIVLMDHWGEVLNALQDSMNSKGAAERRNAIIMDTYAKKMEQLKATVSELQLQFGKAFLPIAKGFIDVLKSIVEAFNNIPPWVKAASTALAGFFVVLSKGEAISNFFRDTFGGVGSLVEDAMDSAKLEFKKGIYEMSGYKFEGFDVRGLKKFSEATHMGELNSILGKATYALAPFGRAWNNFLTDIFRSSSVTVDAVSDVFEKMADGLFGLSDKLGAASVVAGPIAKGLSTAFAGFGAVSDVAGYGLDKIAQLLGLTAQQTAKLTNENTELLGTFGPLVGSFFILEPLLSKAWTGFKRLAVSSKDYEMSMSDVRRNQSEELATIRTVGKEYGNLEKRLANVRKEQTPEGRDKAISEGTYVDPYIEIGKVTGEALKQTNALADANKNLVLSYDQFGNAVLKSTDSLKSFINTAEKAAVGEMFRTQIDILKKHIEDLTDTGMGENIKRELKRFMGEIPGFGPQLAKFIHISPAKVMEEEVSKMNELLSARSRFPMTSGFDKAIAQRNESMKKAREDMQSTYKDFRRVLAELPTEGLGREQIVETLTSPELKKGYEVIANIEPKLKFDKKYTDRQISGFFENMSRSTEDIIADALKPMKTLSQGGPKDIMGVEIMKRIFPKQTFDYTKELTKGLLTQGGVKPRKIGEKAQTGEKVFFVDEISKEFQVAANQGVLNISQTADGFTKATVTIFDKATSQLREVPYEQVSKYVESIFPMANIQQELTENIETLREFITGAEAGLTGIGQKQFKKDFNLGARFFNQVPTTTLVQSSKGYEPGKGYGEIPFKANWPKTLDESFFKPMKEYKLLIDQLDKVKLGEIALDESTLSKLKEYQDIIENNQVVVQYMAVYEDLNKTLADGTRVLEQNLAAERTRVELLTQTAGVLRGLPADLKDVDLGVQNFTDLTAQQRMAFRERGLPPEKQGYLNTVKAIKETETRREGAVTQVTEMRKAIIDLRNIAQVAEGMGVALSPEQLGDYAKNIAVTGDKVSGMTITELNTANKTLSHIDVTLNNLLGVTKGESAISPENLAGMSLDTFVAVAMDLERKRLEAIKSGQTEIALNMEKSLDAMTKTATARFGPEAVLENVSSVGIANNIMKYMQPGMHMARMGAPYMATEYTRRATGASNTKEFIDIMESVKPGISETPEFKKLIALQEEANKMSITDNKTLQQMLSIYSITQVLQKRGAERIVEGINGQISQLEDMKKQAPPGSDVSGIDTQIAKLREELVGATEKAQVSMFKQLIGPMALASEEFLKQLGMSERTVRYLGVGTAAAYAGAKAFEFSTGEKIPDRMQKSFEAAQARAQKGWIGRTIGDIGKAIFGSDEEDLAKVMTEENKAKGEQPVLSKEETKKFEEAIKKSGEEAKKGKGPGDLFNEISTEFRKARDERAKTAADKLLNETQDQTGILLSINEKIGAIADNTIDASKATHGVMKEQHKADKERTDQINEQTQVIRSEYLRKHGGAGALGIAAGAGMAAAGVGYVKNLTQQRNLINSLTGNAAKMAQQMEEINTKYRGPIIEAIKKRQVEVAKAAGATDQEMERISQTLNTREWLDVIIKKIEEKIKTAGGDAEALTASLMALKRSIDDTPDKIAISMQEAMLKGYSESFAASARLGIPGMGAYAGAGFEAGAIPEIPKPKGLEELSGLEAAVALAREKGNTVLEQEVLAYRQLYTNRQEQIGVIDKNNAELYKLYVTMDKLKEIGKEDTSEFGELAVKAGTYLEANKKIRDGLDKSAQSMNKLASVLAVDVFGNLLQSFRKMKEGFMDTEFMENFRNRIGKNFDMMLGGKHPMAPQWPTYDALKAGVPEKDLFKMDKHTMELNSLIGSGKMISAEDIARLEFNKKVAMMQYEQAKEDEKLNRQRSAGEKMMGDLLEARRGVERMPEGSAKEIARKQIGALMTDLENNMNAMAEIVKTVEKPEGYDINMYKGLDLEKQGKGIEAVLATYGINEQQLREIEKSNYLLTNIEKAIREAFGDKIKSPYKPYETPGEKRAREMADEALTKQNMATREESRFAGPGSQYAVYSEKYLQEEAKRAKDAKPMLFDMTGLPGYDSEKYLQEEAARAAADEAKSKEKSLGPWEYTMKRFSDIADALSNFTGAGAETATFVARDLEMSTATVTSEAIKEMGQSASEASDAMKNAAVAIKDAVAKFFSGTMSEVNTEGPLTNAPMSGMFQTGGTIAGPGGPREDKVPILASPGEFIINASASRRLGKDALNYMNTTGQVPSMLRGGGVPRLANGGDLLDYFSNPEKELAPPGVDPWTYNPNETDREKAIRESILRGPDKPLNAQTGIGRGMETLGSFVDNIYGYWSGRDPDNFALPQIANWSKEEEMEFARKNPNLYAATATAASFIPGGRFAYSPTDVEEFNKSGKFEKLVGVVAEAPGKVLAGGKTVASAFKYATKSGTIRKMMSNLDKPVVTNISQELERMGYNAAEEVAKYGDVGKNLRSTLAAKNIENYLGTLAKENPLLSKLSLEGLKESLGKSSNIGVAEWGVKQMLDQLNLMSSTMGTAGRLKTLRFGNVLGDITKQRATLGESLGESLINIVSPNVLESPKRFIKSVMGGERAGNIVSGASENPFKYLMGHEFTHIVEGRSPVLKGIRTKLGQDYKQLGSESFRETVGKISKYPLEYKEKGRMISEFIAELGSSAFTGKTGQVASYAENLKKAFGLTFQEGGPVRSPSLFREALNKLIQKQPNKPEKEMTADEKAGAAITGKLTRQRIEEALGEALDKPKEFCGGGLLRKQYQEGGLVNPLSWWWQKIIGTSSGKGETPSAPEAGRRIEEDKKKKEDIMKELFGAAGGRQVSNWDKIVEKANKHMRKSNLTSLSIDELMAYRDELGGLTLTNKDRGPGSVAELERNMPRGMMENLMLELGLKKPEDIYRAPSGNFISVADMFAFKERDLQGPAAEDYYSRQHGGKWTLSNLPEKIPHYQTGTSYVPRDQIARVDKGEAIIPAKYNMGGIVEMPRFQTGGGVDASRYVNDIGEQVGDAIAKKLEDVTLKLETTEVTAKLNQDKVELDTTAFEDLVTRLENTKIDFNIPDASDLPKLEIGNLNDVRTALERGVGAERGQSKLDTFIDKIDNELRQFDAKITENAGKVEMLERVNDPVKLEELTGLIDGISTKMDDVYTKAQHAIDAAEEKSRIESRLQDMISDVKSNDLTPMKSEISMIHYTLNDAVREVNENYDKLVSLGNRIGMK